MRRADRAVTDPAKIEAIISRCSCCRIGFCDSGEIYIVPLNFGYEKQGDAYTFYFHGAKAGRKIGLIRKAPHVGFELDTDHAVYANGDNGTACSYTARFQSIIGSGNVSIVSDPEEQKRGLSLLMAHTTGRQDFQFDENMLRAVTVFKLTVTELSCKEHL